MIVKGSKKLKRMTEEHECENCGHKSFEVVHAYLALPDGDVEPTDLCTECGWFVYPVGKMQEVTMWGDV